MAVKTDCSRSHITAALARVRLSEMERRTAEDCLEKGERIADLIIGAAAALRSVTHGVERALRALGGAWSAH